MNRIFGPAHEILVLMRGSRKFCQRGSNNVFFDEWKEDPIRTKSGPLKHHFKELSWRADNGPTLNAGLVKLCDFSGYF